ncbi:MAG: adenosine deaminase [Candidatus Sulfotelmatobacter sp.]
MLRRDIFTAILRRCILILLLTAVAVAQNAVAQNNEQRTTRYLDSIRKQPPLLGAFLRDLPKGGDLHNHLDGAIYAEDLIDFAAAGGLCVDRTSSRLLAPPCDSCENYTAKPAASCSYGDHVLYGQMIDAWSMRNWKPGDESGHDHFFAAFDKFGLAAHTHVAEAIAAATNRAGMDRLQYVEFMHTADAGAAAQLAAKVAWTPDYAKMRDSLIGAGMKDVAAETGKRLAADNARAKEILKCGTPDAAPGCDVTVRYLYQVLRGLPHEIVFAQILLGFELASSDPRFVGLNLVMPEDWYVPIHDFNEHMAMIDYLHSVYPKVHIALHAGELALGLVPPEDLTFHVRASVERGHAERIGHGVDVMNEKDPIGLLHEMAERNVLVEIALTSNDMILGVTGDDHPLPVYMKYGVPVALATDDEGVSRSDMTNEYLRAVETYHLSYGDLKRMARQSLDHSFLPGASLWTDTKIFFRIIPACGVDIPGAEHPSAACEQFLAASERARMQWRLEGEFFSFEKKY